MTTMASQITSLTVVYSTVYSDADQRKHESSASLAFVWGIHRWPVNSPHKRPVTRKMFPFDDVIMRVITINYYDLAVVRMYTVLMYHFLFVYANCPIEFDGIHNFVIVPHDWYATRSCHGWHIMLMIVYEEIDDGMSDVCGVAHVCTNLPGASFTSSDYLWPWLAYVIGPMIFCLM